MYGGNNSSYSTISFRKTKWTINPGIIYHFIVDLHNPNTSHTKNARWHEKALTEILYTNTRT